MLHDRVMSHIIIFNEQSDYRPHPLSNENHDELVFDSPPPPRTFYMLLSTFFCARNNQRCFCCSLCEVALNFTIEVVIVDLGIPQQVNSIHSKSLQSFFLGRHSRFGGEERNPRLS